MSAGLRWLQTVSMLALLQQTLNALVGGEPINLASDFAGHQLHALAIATMRVATRIPGTGDPIPTPCSANACTTKSGTSLDAPTPAQGRHRHTAPGC